MDHAAEETNVAAAGALKDPVCAMTVDPATAQHRFAYRGTMYYFCGARCRSRFESDPEKFLHPEPAQVAPPSSAIIYTCPMHPEIRRDGPGACPICGMALEPLEPQAEAGPDAELIDMTRRFWIASVLAVPVLFLGMSELIPGMPLQRVLGERLIAWLEFILTTPVVLWAGAPFFARGWRSIVNRQLNMFTLISLGVGIAYLYSVSAIFVPAIFPPNALG